MAWTVTKTPTVFGNKRAVLINATADAAETNLETGLKVVEAYTIGIKSSATGTALPHVALNANSSGTASNGTLGISGVTSGDAFCFVVYGR